MFSCTKCLKGFSKCHLYLTHIKYVHSHEPFFHYVCGCDGCPITFFNFQSLRKHLLTHEELNPNINNVKMVCSCGFRSYLKNKFISHFKNHNLIVCPVKDCNSTYNIYSSFSSHISRKHSCFKPIDIKPYEYSQTNSPNQIPGNELSNFPIENINDKILEKLNNLTNNVSLFIIKIQEKFLLPEAVVSELISGMSQLQEDSVDLFKTKVLRLLKEKGHDDDEILKTITELPSSYALISTYRTMSSSHLKSKYMVNSLGLIEPIQYTLGYHQRKQATYQYVPILKNLQAFIKNTDVIKFVVNNQNNDRKTIFEDIYNGNTFKKNKLFTETPNIQIILYYDEFSFTNPLRGNQSKHKMGVFYYTLGNIPIKFRSTVDDIQLAIICKSFYIKKFGLDSVLAPLIKDLKVLEIEGLTVDSSVGNIKGSVVFLISDNLGAHQIGGFSTCFNNNSVTCRFCCATSAEMQTEFNSSSFVRRTPDMYKRQIDLINVDPSYSAVYGLKFDSPLNDLSHFHSTTSLPPDAMHDLLEGIVPMELKLIIKRLISSKFFTLDQLNSKIVNFRYGPNDSPNKPHPLLQNYEKGLKMNAARVWCFIRLLPLMLGESVPEDNPVWNLLIVLREIVDIVLSPKVTISYISYLSDLINDHHRLFKTLFPDITLKPKHHFLVHYPNLILEFGPLISCWSMRFESKHLYFKRIAQNIKNSINLPFSLAMKHQKLQCYYNYTSSRHVGKFSKISNVKPLKIDSYADDVSEILVGFSDFFVASMVEVNGVMYKPGLCLPLKFLNEEPLFSKIIIILCKGEEVRFVCRTFTSHTIFHILGYKLCETECIKVLSIDDFLDTYPLSVYQFGGDSVLIPKYLIFDH